MALPLRANRPTAAATPAKAAPAPVAAPEELHDDVEQVEEAEAAPAAVKTLKTPSKKIATPAKATSEKQKSFPVVGRPPKTEKKEARVFNEGDALTQDEFRTRFFNHIQREDVIEQMGFQLTTKSWAIGLVEALEDFMRTQLVSHDLRFAGMQFKRHLINRPFRNMQAKDENDQVLVTGRIAVKVNHNIVQGTSIPGRIDSDGNFVPAEGAAAIVAEDNDE